MTYSRSSHQVFYKKRCSQKFRKFHKKTSVSESLFKLSCRRQAEVIYSSRSFHQFSSFVNFHFHPIASCFYSNDFSAQQTLLMLPPKRIMKAKDVMDWSGFLSTWIQLFKSVLQRCCCEKFRKIHRNNSKTIIP